MLIAVLIPATVLAAAWIAFLLKADREDWVAAAYNRVLQNQMEIERLHRKGAANQNKLEKYHGIPAKMMKLILKCSFSKEIEKLETQNTALQGGNLKSLSPLILPGYAIQRQFPAIGRGGIHKRILEQYIELYGKKHAANQAKQLLAQMLSYSILGIASSLTLGVMLMPASFNVGLAIISIGTILVIVLVYSLYDEMTDRLKKRRIAIQRQFPNVVSKLALLVTSGMIMERAWRETAESQELELYQEMRRTADEMANLVRPADAYANFIDRCNTKETTKLASAIIQNQSKGNAEIGMLLKNMAQEAWQERRHMAKRDSEAANSKLMIPTMMLFIAILVIIMVPVVLNFSGLM